LTTGSSKEEKKGSEEKGTGKRKGAKGKKKQPEKKKQTTCKVPSGWDSISRQYEDWAEILRQLREDNGKITGDLCDRECGGGGDCMFHVIAYILTLFINTYGTEDDKEILKHAGGKFTQADVREIFANALTEADVDLKNQESLLSQYVTEQQEDWDEDWWQPDEIAEIENSRDRLAGLQKQVRQSGMSFQGDHIALQVLQKLLTKLYGIGFVMMTDTGSFVCHDYQLRVSDPNIKYWAFFINIEGAHFKLVGFDSGVPGSSIQFIFPRDHLPETIRILLKDICHYQNLRTGKRRRERGENFDIVTEVIQPRKKAKT
jgi:hypothetical protein